MSDPSQNSGALDSFKIQAMQGGGGGAAGNYWLKDQQMGAGLSLQNLAPGKGQLPVTFFQDKGTGFKDKLQSGLGIRTRAQFVGFEEVGPAEPAVAGDIHGSGDGGGGDMYGQAASHGETILQNGAYFMGQLDNSMLTGVGAVTPPATPGMSREKEGVEIG